MKRSTVKNMIGSTIVDYFKHYLELEKSPLTLAQLEELSGQILDKVEYDGKMEAPLTGGCSRGCCTPYNEWEDE